MKSTRPTVRTPIKREESEQPENVPVTSNKRPRMHLLFWRWHHITTPSVTEQVPKNVPGLMYSSVLCRSKQSMKVAEGQSHSHKHCKRWKSNG